MGTLYSDTRIFFFDLVQTESSDVPFSVDIELNYATRRPNFLESTTSII